MEPEASELPKGLALGWDGNIHIRITPLGDVRSHIFGSTNAPAPVGLLAGKGSRCRDFLAFGKLRTASYFDVDSLFNRKLDHSRKGK